MSPLTLAFLAAGLALTVGEICYDAQLGLALRFCQPCGSPGLDDFCIKRYGRCGTYITSQGYYGGGNLGGGNGLPPFGYLSGGPSPTSCQKLKDMASIIPNRNGITGTIPVYLQAADWGKSLPRVYFNPAVVNYLEVLFPLHQCLESDAPFPNGRWNWANPYDASYGTRVDSFFYNDNGNSTWSYQCYCDYCNSCQSCTHG